MARRNTRSSIRRVRKGAKDLIWVTTIVEASLLEGVATNIADLILPVDWSQNAGFDRCTLLGIRGWLSYAQTAAATAAEASGAFVTVYKADAGLAAPMNPAVAADYSGFDVLWSDGIALTNAASVNPERQQLELKAKRRLTSADAVHLAAIVSIDTGAPRVNFLGCFRSFLQTE